MQEHINQQQWRSQTRAHTGLGPGVRYVEFSTVRIRGIACDCQHVLQHGQVTDTEDALRPKQTDLPNIATKKRRLESDPAASSTQVPFTGDQTNNITSTGPTTIVVNSSSTPDPILNESLNAVHEGINSYTDTMSLSEPPDDIAQTPASPPVQPRRKEYPVTYFSNKPRSFIPAWFNIY